MNLASFLCLMIGLDWWDDKFKIIGLSLLKNILLALYLYLYWYAGKCVTTGSLRKKKKKVKALIYRVFQFSWNKFFHHGNFQTVSSVAVNADLWWGTYNWFLWIHSSKPLYLLHNICHPHYCTLASYIPYLLPFIVNMNLWLYYLSAFFPFLIHLCCPRCLVFV